MMAVGLSGPRGSHCAPDSHPPVEVAIMPTPISKARLVPPPLLTCATIAQARILTGALTISLPDSLTISLSTLSTCAKSSRTRRKRQPVAELRRAVPSTRAGRARKSQDWRWLAGSPCRQFELPSAIAQDAGAVTSGNVRNFRPHCRPWLADARGRPRCAVRRGGLGLVFDTGRGSGDGIAERANENRVERQRPRVSAVRLVEGIALSLRGRALALLALRGKSAGRRADWRSLGRTTRPWAASVESRGQGDHLPRPQGRANARRLAGG